MRVPNPSRKVFPLISAIQAVKGLYSFGPSYSSSWQQSLAAFLWFWLFRHAECKSYGVMEAPTQISKEGL